MNLKDHFKTAAKHNQKLADAHEAIAGIHGGQVDSHGSAHRELQKAHAKLAKLYKDNAEHLVDMSEADDESLKVSADAGLSADDRAFLRKLVEID